MGQTLISSFSSARSGSVTLCPVSDFPGAHWRSRACPDCHSRLGKASLHGALH